MIKFLIHFNLLIHVMVLVQSQITQLKLHTTSIPTLIPPSSIPFSSTLISNNPPTSITSYPITSTKPLYLEHEYFLLLVQCGSQCKRLDPNELEVKKQVKNELELKTGTYPKHVDVKVAGNNQVVIKGFVEHKSIQDKSKFKNWLDSQSPSLNISSVTGNISSSSLVTKSYTKSDETTCNRKDRCRNEACLFEHFSSKQCFCPLYHNETCTWNKNFLWFLIIPFVILLVLLVLLGVCCKRNQHNIFNQSSKRELYLQTYEDVNSNKSIKKLEENIAVEYKKSANDDVYSNVINNPTFVGNVNEL